MSKADELLDVEVKEGTPFAPTSHAQPKHLLVVLLDHERVQVGRLLDREVSAHGATFCKVAVGLAKKFISTQGVLLNTTEGMSERFALGNDRRVEFGACFGVDLVHGALLEVDLDVGILVACAFAPHKRLIHLVLVAEVRKLSTARAVV